MDRQQVSQMQVIQTQVPDSKSMGTLLQDGTFIPPEDVQQWNRDNQHLGRQQK